MDNPAIQWKRLSDRFDRLSLRERSVLILGAICVLLLVADALVLGPLGAKEKALAQQEAGSIGEMTQMKAQLAVAIATKSVDPDQANRERITRLTGSLTEQEAQIRDQMALLVDSGRMAQVLKSLLANRSRVQLAEMRTLPQTSINLATQAAPVAGSPAKGAGNQDLSPHAVLYRHGIRMTLRGSYLDLLGYLKDIEALPIRFYWDRLELSVVEYPLSQMTVVVNTISVDPAWMKI